MAAPKEIEALVADFERDQNFYKSNQFNETELRTRFINPMIKALGWDGSHDLPGRADQHEVKEEDSVEVEGKIKNPDYSFRLFDSSLGAMKRKFFIEVKRPSINIESGAYPAFQLRRYAFSADLPISILTDFEEFSVYYCLSRPNREDKPAKLRIMYLRYDQYAEKWPEIAALFSREAVMGGSLDRYARSLPQKRGEKRVDAALLDDISKWREALAKKIALRNPELDTVSLNYSVQAIIDRIMFLRICEDRGIEQYMRLQHLLEGERVYVRLFELFRQADGRYNSGIFHFEKEPGRDRPDIITPNLKIDDGTLKDIIKQLYPPESPYAFSVLPAEILGQIYEQFLGQVIRLDQDHNALVEDKPEVKKAGGVKYTPAYIVEAIVQKTLHPTLEGKTPLQAAEVSVLDPACGSGSFLIVAYQYLLDWHRDWYFQHMVPLLKSQKPSSPEIRRLLPAAQEQPGRRGRKMEPELPIFEARDGEWRLTTAERKRILLANIYGVDIDRQAVEVTKLSLLLKVLEGENDETISKQLKLFQERALPDLGNNIKCGNSLIGWDILEDKPDLGQEEIERINPFDWEREFPEIFQRGGFSVLIGNPPYVRPHNLPPIIKEYFWIHYHTFVKKSDLYCCFIERGISLLKSSGLFGFIVSDGWLRLDSFENLRKFLLSETSIHTIIDFEDYVFDGASVKVAILILTRSRDALSNNCIDLATCSASQNIGELKFNRILQERFKLCYKYVIDLSINDSNEAIKQKMKAAGVLLGEILDVSFGLKTGDDSIFLTYSPDTSEHRPLLRGEDIHRYKYNYKGEYVWYVPDKMTAHRKTARPGVPERFEQAKILIRDTGNGLQGTYDSNNYYVKDVLIVSAKNNSTNLMFFMGLLNSNLMRFFYETTFPTLHVQRNELASLPVLVLNLSDPADVARHDRMVSLVEQMLSLHKQLPQARTPHEQTALERQIEAADRQIDALVYELYALTEEEIGIVEGRG